MPAEPAPPAPPPAGSERHRAVRHDPRAEPHAAREMASMFDEVSPRYDLLNRLMTLGQDAAWRRAMWRAVPERARVVLDLCTGNGVSLAGLRRPGRLVLGVDVSLVMLEQALATHGRAGWAPRLACADAFRLPLRDGSVDAITIAFGARNLRPREQALAEMMRVLRPGGVLAVLEGTAPRGGLLAPFHRFYLTVLLPLLGRLSPEPGAYRYLGESILEFGAGPEFEGALEGAGFAIEHRNSFMMGAARLWSARARGEKDDSQAGTVHFAVSDGGRPGDMPHPEAGPEAEHRWWTLLQLGISAVLLASLIVVLVLFFTSADRLPLDRNGRRGAALLLAAGTLFSTVRTLFLLRRVLAPPERR